MSSQAQIYPRFEASEREGVAEKRAIPWAIYIPLIYFAARGFFSFQTSGSQTGGFTPGIVLVRDQGFVGSVLLPAIVYFTSLRLIARRWADVWRVIVQARLLLVLALLAPLSALWSQDPAKSLEFGVCYLLDTFFAAYLVATFDTETLLVLLNRLTLILCIASMLTVALLPAYGISTIDPRYPHVWLGIFAARGDAARVLVFLIPAVLALPPQLRNRTRMLALLLGLLFLFNIHTMTVYILLLVCCVSGAMQAMNERLGDRTSLVFLSLMLTAFATLAVVMLVAPESVLTALGRDPSLTGRTEIWEQLVGSIMKRPLLGYGYHAFWLGLQGESGVIIRKLNWTFGYAHNGYFEVTLQLGFVGLGLVIAILLRAMKNAWFCLRHVRGSQSSWYITVILVTVLYNVDDCTVAWPKDLVSIFFLVACYRLAQLVAQIKSGRYLSGDSVHEYDLSSSRRAS